MESKNDAPIFAGEVAENESCNDNTQHKPDSSETQQMSAQPLSADLDYPLAPFRLNTNEIEHINLNSGSLGLTITDFVLPGKNGFDLSLTRRYDSSIIERYISNSCGLGHGWCFGFPSIETLPNRDGRENYLHTGDGRRFLLGGSSNQPVSIEGHTLQDIRFSGNPRNPNTTNFTLTFNRDGRTAAFRRAPQSIGSPIRLTSMSDRQGNTIHFNLTENGGTITDTVGKTIRLTRTNITGGYILTW